MRKQTVPTRYKRYRHKLVITLMVLRLALWAIKIMKEVAGLVGS